MEEQRVSLKKSFHFNSRYKDTPAFKTAFTIIRACGDTGFYYSIKSSISDYLNSLNTTSTTSTLNKIQTLTPRATQVNTELLDTAQQKFLKMMEMLKESPYEFGRQYEDMTYPHQVFFCLISALCFLAEVQVVERMVYQIDEKRPEYLQELQRQRDVQKILEERSAGKQRR